MTSNVAEKANACLEEALHEDPVSLFACYKWKLNSLFTEWRVVYGSLPPDSLPEKVFGLLKESMERSRKLQALRHSDDLFEVQRLRDQRPYRVVDLAARTCTCGFPREFGVPCRHM